ncbi:MAG: helix-turn-helix domain-containing protein [Clostridia bacterium]|nr:helix-turn-helix domain-containing protein [Clostridia bacterium]
MTSEQKYDIDRLQQRGMGYRKIASELGVSPNTVKSYLRRNQNSTKEIQGVCKQCKKPVKQTPHKKAKVFCSNYCRSKWWRNNTDLVESKACVVTICKGCGKEFITYKCQKRSFCSRRCYVQSLNNEKGMGSYNDEK